MESFTITKQRTLFRNLSLSDALEQQTAQDWLPLEITQLSAGAYQGQLREIQHDDVSVFFEQQNCMVHKRGVIDDDVCTVSFFRSTNGVARFSEYNALENSLFFLPSGTDVDIQVGGDVETVYFKFNQSQLLERARIVNPQRWDTKPDSNLVFNKLNRKSLDKFAQYLYSHPSFHPGAKKVDDNEVLLSSIMDRVLLALDSSSVDDDAHRDLMANRRANGLVSQSIAYINRAFGDNCCPSIVDICAEIKVSQRNLQYSFKKILGLTPNAYLYHLRLNRVRTQLSNPNNANVTVAQVASHWHFWHLGRFANDYLQLFGELPSTTLSRALR